MAHKQRTGCAFSKKMLSVRLYWAHTFRCAPALIGSVLVLTKLSQQWRKPLSLQSRLAEYLICLARLGGYLARAHDPPPGNFVIWRGMRRLSGLPLGAQIAKHCG